MMGRLCEPFKILNSKNSNSDASKATHELHWIISCNTRMFCEFTDQKNKVHAKIKYGNSIS